MLQWLRSYLFMMIFDVSMYCISHDTGIILQYDTICAILNYPVLAMLMRDSPCCPSKHISTGTAIPEYDQPSLVSQDSYGEEDEEEKNQQ